MNDDPKGNYAEVNGLEMYYEIHGAGRPLVVLHGAYMTIGMMGEVVPGLAETRQVIAVELQGHGHTADIDRPTTYKAMADDTAALLRHLGIEQADIFGFSMGGGVALQVAIRHPWYRGADLDRRRGLRRHPPRARRRDVQVARWRRDGGFGEPPQVPTRGAPRHRPLRAAEQWAPGPRRVAAGNGSDVPRRADA